MQVIKSGNTVCIQHESLKAQATIRPSETVGETYEIYYWYRDEFGERMGLISPELWEFNPNEFRSTFSAASGFVVMYGSVVESSIMEQLI